LRPPWAVGRVGGLPLGPDVGCWIVSLLTNGGKLAGGAGEPTPPDRDGRARQAMAGEMQVESTRRTMFYPGRIATSLRPTIPVDGPMVCSHSGSGSVARGGIRAERVRHREQELDFWGAKGYTWSVGLQSWLVVLRDL